MKNINITLSLIDAKTLIHPKGTPQYNDYEYDQVYQKFVKQLETALFENCKHEFGKENTCIHCGARLTFR